MSTDPRPPVDDLTLTEAPTGEGKAGRSPAPESAAPDRQLGDYELQAELARGGMGVVYRARQVSLNRLVALKMILAGRLAGEADVQRFRLEAEAAAGLDHPNILPIYEVGEHAGRPYYSMKLVEGGTLATRLKESPRMDIQGLCGLLVQITRAVHYAHQRGILHRDLKPANVLLDADGTPFVTDFGLAKKAEADSGLTHTGAILGTPSYMAPEQAAGKGVTTAADVYALGAILYECLTGRPPFRGDSIAQTLRMVEEQEPIAPRSLDATADPDLEAVALKCLEKNPGRRYETAAALADDLEAWRRGEPVTARRAGIGRRTWKWVRRNPAVAGLTALIFLSLVAGASVSTVYAVKADERARAAAESEREAREQEAIVRERDEVLQDTLCVATFERARADRLAGRPGWRSRSLELLREAARLRQRPRLTDEPQAALPALPDMRSEAVMALIAHDARPAREIPLSMTSPTHFGPDGRFLAQVSVAGVVGGSGEVRVIDLTDGRVRHQIHIDLSGTPNQDALSLITLLALSPDGSHAACRNYSVTGSLDVRAFPTGRLTARLQGPAAGKPLPNLLQIRFDPTGRRVAAVRNSKTEAEVVVWALDSPAAPAVLLRESVPNPTNVNVNMLVPSADSGIFAGPRFSPDGTRLYVGTADRKTIRVYDLTATPPTLAAEVPAPGKLIALECHPKVPVLALAVHREDGSAAVVLWDLEQNKERARCDAQPWGSHLLASLGFSPDGRWLAMSDGSDTAIRVIETTGGGEVVRLTDAAAVGVYRVFWTPAGLLGSAGFMEGLRFWQPDEAPLCDRFRLRAVGRPAFAPDDQTLAVFAPTQVRSPRSEINEILGARDERAPLDRIALLDRRTGQVARWLPGTEATQAQVLFSPDGQRVAVEAEGTVVVRDARTGDEVHRRVIAEAKGVQHQLAAFYLPDGRLAAVRRQGPGKDRPGVEVWDLQADRPLFPRDTLAPLDTYAVSQDGGRLYLEDPMRVLGKGKNSDRPTLGRLLELPSGRLLGEVPAPPRTGLGFYDLARLSRRGDRVLSVSIGGADGLSLANSYWSVRALPSGAELLRVPNRSMTDEACDFSPDGRLLCLGSDRGQVEVWDVDTGVLLFRWQPHGGKTVQAVTFSPAGDLATVAEADDRVAVLRLNEVRDRLTAMGLGW